MIFLILFGGCCIIIATFVFSFWLGWLLEDKGIFENPLNGMFIVLFFICLYAQFFQWYLDYNCK